MNIMHNWKGIVEKSALCMASETPDRENCVGILIICYVSYFCWKVMQGNFDVYIAAIIKKDRVFPRYIFLLLMQFSFS